MYLLRGVQNSVADERRGETVDAPEGVGDDGAGAGWIEGGCADGDVGDDARLRARTWKGDDFAKRANVADV